jgi:hypothetical protein
VPAMTDIYRENNYIVILLALWSAEAVYIFINATLA